jgi:hypothetical protein
MKSEFGKGELPVFHVFLLTHFLNPEVPFSGVACRSLAHDSRSELGERHAMELNGTGVSAKGLLGFKRTADTVTASNKDVD